MSKLSEIADRLEAWGKDWVGLDKQMDALQPRRAELVAIITDLRALDGKTVLPGEIAEVLEGATNQDIKLHWTGADFLARTTNEHVDVPRGYGPTPAAAIDALAEEIRKGKP